MPSAKKHFELFLVPFGGKLATLGFPLKIKKRSNFFEQQTESGRVGIHVGVRFYPTGDSSFMLRTAASFNVVQDILVETELYAKGSADTWTFGCDIYNLRNEGRDIRPVKTKIYPDGRTEAKISNVKAHVKKYGSSFYDIDYSFSAKECEAVAELAFGHVKNFAWPHLLKFGTTEEGALKLAMQSDIIADSSFTDPKRALTALILARHLRREGLIPDIFKTARRRYKGFARLGNPAVLDQFERVAKKIGFDYPPETTQASRGVLNWIKSQF